MPETRGKEFWVGFGIAMLLSLMAWTCMWAILVIGLAHT